MKKLNVKDLKSIKGGDWRIFCRRQCLDAYRSCTVTNPPDECEQVFADCMEGCL